MGQSSDGTLPRPHKIDEKQQHMMGPALSQKAGAGNARTVAHKQSATAAPGQENVPVGTPSAKPAGKKRKSTEPHAGAESRVPAKKQKANATPGAAASAAVDISDIQLPGEEFDEVPVFDTCDEIRRKINAHLTKSGVTQAQFCRDIYAQLKGPSRPANVPQSSTLATFRRAKGAVAGAKSYIFYGAYVYFEKLRIKQGKPKTKHRLAMEETWGKGGMDRTMDHRQT